MLLTSFLCQRIAIPSRQKGTEKTLGAELGYNVGIGLEQVRTFLPLLLLFYS